MGEEDAYCLAMAFGSSVSADDHDDVGRGGREGTSSARKTIERRLEMIVSRINAAGGVDGSAAGPNVDGARPYFSSLLRTLIRPRDPDAWSRWSIDESRGGGETHLTTLRRGRAALVSFLVAIDTPGRENAVVRLLAPSPVPSYLGYLSPSEDYRTPRRREKEQVVHRSSYFLPAAEEGGDAMLPPPPMVTEVGLSMCVRNFLHGDAPDIVLPRSSGRRPRDIQESWPPAGFPRGQYSRKLASLYPHSPP